jgi:NAD(P)-dependent dehydrogenase (short-subunit alcohol dehydrogenase family)
MESVDLDGVVCVVTGASRGAGRGIAHELATRGASVFITGRNAGSLDETVTLIRTDGGACVPVRCDHTVDDDADALFARVRRDHGRLDVLVNNAWGGYEQRGESAPFFDAPFWEQPLWRWEGMFTAGVRASFVTSRYAAPLLLERRAERPGLVVNTIAWAFGAYLGNVLYDTAKAATARMAFGMAQELRAHRVACVALALGRLGVSETPRYGGRAIVALARDPNVLSKFGELLTASGLARDYGFTDIDGTQPEPFALAGQQIGPQ